MATIDDKRLSRSSTAQTRLPSLTGLRWVAALLVFVFHLGYVGGPTGAALHTVLGRAGHLGVAFFFILSGFVLTWSARPNDRVLSFWRRRLAKIVPNHWVTFLVTIVLMVLTGQVLAFADIAPNFFLVQTWVPRLEAWTSVNPVSWSLACELLFYLSFPLWKRLLDRVPESKLWLTAGLVAAAILAVPLLVQGFVSDQPRIPFDTFGPISFNQLWLVYFFPVSRVFEFILGIVLARIVMSGRWVPVSIPVATLLVVAGQVFALTIADTSYLVSTSAVPALPVALLIAAVANADARGRPTGFGGRRMVWLGEISFAFYMVHKIVMTYLQQLFAGEGEQWGAPWPVSQWLLFSVTCFAVTLVGAALLYRFVEIPSLNRFGRSRPQRALVSD
jgi:peptidoglycan/LPS O-acetylase OafA/YrhL